MLLKKIQDDTLSEGQLVVSCGASWNTLCVKTSTPSSNTLTLVEVEPGLMTRILMPPMVLLPLGRRSSSTGWPNTQKPILYHGYSSVPVEKG